MIYKFIIVSLFTFFGLVSQAQHINGITAVATPDPFPSDPYPRLMETNANWVCLVPYGFSRLGNTELWYNMDRQWWGETVKGVVENIKLAKSNGLKVFLKPQIYVPGSWPGDIDFKNEENWQKWEAAYTSFIMTYVDLATEYEVEMLCIGTEFKISETKRASFWENLIEDIRCKYSGKLTYSSNWDSFAQIGFWNKLDYVGISSYFPLVEDDLPSPTKLNKAWKTKIKNLNQFHRKSGKKILFTEYGYLSVDGCAGETWMLEKKVRSLDINQQAQANAFEALYSNLWDENFWAGGFIWKWFPHGKGAEGYIERDYTPQDKLAEQVVARWFGRDSK